MDPLCHLVKRGDIFFRIMFSKIILYTKETQYVTVIKTLRHRNTGVPFVVGPVAANFEAVMSGNGISRCVQCLSAIRTYLWFLSLKALLIPP